jgi:hypothetical protein
MGITLAVARQVDKECLHSIIGTACDNTDLISLRDLGYVGLSTSQRPFYSEDHSVG